MIGSTPQLPATWFSNAICSRMPPEDVMPHRDLDDLAEMLWVLGSIAGIALLFVLIWWLL